jgi:hypothetical protein
MTDYSVADEITSVLQSVEPVFAGAFHGDFYEIVRDVRTSDGRGGYTTAPGVVESGRCALIPRQTQGREGLSGDVVQSTYRMAAELPADSTAKADDVLDVNDVRYQIIAITQPGNHDLFPLADLERVT